MPTLSRLVDLYRKGGSRAVGRSVTDFVHYEVSKPWRQRVDGDAVADFYEPNEDGLIPVQLPGYTLYVDPDDPGISADLMSRGIREPASYWTYRRELKQLPSDPFVLEVGANIGYYAIAAAVDRPDGTILCAELDAENTDRLRYNARQNGVSDRLRVENTALSDETTTRTATMTAESNLHTLQVDGGDDSTASERIECVSGDEFLEQYGYDATDVDCLRMDVEGHESRILEGFSGLDPALAHVEVHPPNMDADEWQSVVGTFESWGLDLATVTKKDKRYPVESVGDLPVNRTHQVVLAALGRDH